MPNFIVTYDLSGARPSLREMEAHLGRLGTTRTRILDKVWHVGYEGTAKELLDHLRTVFGEEDHLIVVEAKDATWTTLLTSDRSLVASWSRHR